MTGLPLIAEPGTRASYSQAGYNLLGRVIEKVTGQPFEQAIAELVLQPPGLADTVFDPDDVMTRQFALGHNRDEDGSLPFARPWQRHRARQQPGRRARGHGGGPASLGPLPSRRRRGTVSCLPADVLHSMRNPTVELRSSTLGGAIGICWFIREVDGVSTIGHGGSGNGQFAELLIVPDRDFAIVSLANAARRASRPTRPWSAGRSSTTWG